MRRLHLFILALILVLSLVLRLYHLSARPSGFTWDEAALGYNAYSLLQTGRDEWGLFLPVVFPSFGDYKPGLYIYLAVPSVSLLGLTEFSTRLPSAIFGTLSVLLLYLLAAKLFPARRTFITPSLLSALLLAISPWAIHFSRGAWEANVWVTLTLLGVCLWLYRRLSLSSLFFGLTLWTYQGAKLLTPLLLGLLLLLNRRDYRPTRFIRPFLILAVLLTPILIGLPTQSGRLKVFSLFSYTRQSNTVTDILSADKESSPGPLYYLFHTELLNQLRGFAQRYSNHFSSHFLFSEGDWSNLRQSTPYHGNLYLYEVVTLLLGLTALVRHSSRRTFVLLLGWILVAPLGSALSRDVISGVRSLPLVIPLTLISAYGLWRLISRPLLSLPVIGVIIISLFYFLDMYFIHAPYYSGPYWLSSVDSAFELVKTESPNYDHVIITQKFGQPYIFALFYLRYPPIQFQTDKHFTPSEVGDVGSIDSFGKYTFRPIYWPADRGESSTLYLSDEFELPESDLQQTANIRRLGEFKFPNGRLFLRAVAMP